MAVASEARSLSGTQRGLTYQVYQLGRKLVRLPILKAWNPKELRYRVQSWMLASVIDQLPDRRYMEEVILPTIVALKPARLLDVGVQEYSRHYGGKLPTDCEYWTLDLNPDVAQHGSPGRHIVGNVLDVSSFFEPCSLDLVLMNGPFGYGIDRVDEQERTIEGVRTILRPGGWLLIGWDLASDGRPNVIAFDELGDQRIKDPVELESIRSHFDHVAPLGLPNRIDFDGCSHIYDWFRAR